MLAAIIVAGGSSQRMGFDKTFALLAGRPVVAHSIAAFEATEAVSEIIVVGRAETLPELEAVIAAENFGKIRAIIAGGNQRQDSVSRGLEALNVSAKYVAVHDAARPLVRPEEIERVYAHARAHGAAALAAPVRDTLKRAESDFSVSESIVRENVFAMETPQIFGRELLLKAYEKVAAEKLAITDEVTAAQRLGHKVILVPNEQYNFKITFPSDLALAELIVQARAG